MLELALDEICPECGCDGASHDEMGCAYHLDCTNICTEEDLYIKATDEWDSLTDGPDLES